MTSLSLFAGLPQPYAADHPCRSELIAQGQPAVGGTGSLFRLDGADRRYKLDGLLITDTDIPVAWPDETRLFAVKDNKPDRYGRIAVQAFFSKDGAWLQGGLLRKGSAFQYALGLEPDCVDAMRSAEQAARDAKIGLWATSAPVFSAGKPDDLLQHIGEFVIVTGIVKSVGDRKRRLYLNFGSNWAEDVTVTIVKKGSGAYRGDVAVLQRLEGKRVEIRGIVEDAQGPLIRLIDEAQIDILSR